MENIIGHYGINMFDIKQLMELDSITNNRNKTISKKEYELFCKEFIFNKLKNQRFGDAFCQRFDFNDVVLRNLSDDTAKHLIESLGYIK